MAQSRVIPLPLATLEYEQQNEATTRLTESETQLAQAQIVIESIQKDSEVTAKQVKSSILTEGNS